MTADTTNDARQLNRSAIYVVSGTPSTVATLRPPITIAIALGASFGPACLAAAVMATAQNTGCKNAGRIRAIMSMVKLDDIADNKFERTNMPSTRHMINLRSSFAVSILVNGPARATVKANALNSQPAVSIEI